MRTTPGKPSSARWGFLCGGKLRECCWSLRPKEVAGCQSALHETAGPGSTSPALGFFLPCQVSWRVSQSIDRARIAGYKGSVHRMYKRTRIHIRVCTHTYNIDVVRIYRLSVQCVCCLQVNSASPLKLLSSDCVVTSVLTPKKKKKKTRISAASRPFPIPEIQKIQSPLPFSSAGCSNNNGAGIL